MQVADWLNYLQVDPQNQLVQHLLDKLGMLNDRRLKELSLLSFFYAGLFLTEGTGLAFRKRWAEYFTIITTSSLLPIEAYEIVKRVNAVRILFLLVNIAVVLYLIWEVRHVSDQIADAVSKLHDFPLTLNLEVNFVIASRGVIHRLFQA